MPFILIFSQIKGGESAGRAAARVMETLNSIFCTFDFDTRQLWYFDRLTLTYIVHCLLLLEMTCID